MRLNAWGRFKTLPELWGSLKAEGLHRQWEMRRRDNMIVDLYLKGTDCKMAYAVVPQAAAIRPRVKLETQRIATEVVSVLEQRAAFVQNARRPSKRNLKRRWK